MKAENLSRLQFLKIFGKGFLSDITNYLKGISLVDQKIAISNMMPRRFKQIATLVNTLLKMAGWVNNLGPLRTMQISRAALADMCQTHINTITAWVAKLESLGFIEVERVKTDWNMNDTNKYTFTRRFFSMLSQTHLETLKKSPFYEENTLKALSSSSTTNGDVFIYDAVDLENQHANQDFSDLNFKTEQKINEWKNPKLITFEEIAQIPHPACLRPSF